MNTLVDQRTPAGDLKVAWTEANGDAPGAPLVLIHGNWSGRVWWEPVMQRLPRHVRAIAPDLRGRGETQGPDGSYAIAALAADVVRLLDALGVDGFHIAGHSLGSAVALDAALRYPGRVRSVAVIAAAWVDGMPSLFHQPMHQRALADRTILDHALRPLAPAAPRDDLWRRCVDAGHRQRMEAALRNLDALTAWRPGDTLGEIAVPRLVLSGALDALTGGATSRRAAAALKTPLVVVPAVGHCIPLEAPDRCVRELVQLFEAGEAQASQAKPAV